MMQLRDFPFLSEEIKKIYVDAEDTEDKVSDKYEFEIERKKSEEKLEGEEIEKELEHDEREKESEHENEDLLCRVFNG